MSRKLIAGYLFVVIIAVLLSGCGPLNQRLIDGTAVASGQEVDSPFFNPKDSTGGNDQAEETLTDQDLIATRVQIELDKAAEQLIPTETSLPSETNLATPVIPTSTPNPTFTSTLTEPDLMRTSLAKTIAALETGTPTTEPAITFTPTEGPTPTISPTPVPCLAMKFIADVTYPPYTIVQPSTTFYKTWYIQNVGSCTWNGDFSIVHYDGFQLGGTTPLRLGSGVSVPPGKYVSITIQLWTGPQTGEFISLWMLADNTGTLFGGGPAQNEPLVVRIVVPGESPPVFTQPVSTAPPFYTPTPP